MTTAEDAPQLALADLQPPLEELGRRWATSPHRPRPSRTSLDAWDSFLSAWLNSDLPLLWRDGRRRGSEPLATACGRMLFFADNSPANWAMGLALEDKVPSLIDWSAATMAAQLPLTFLTKGEAAQRDLNRRGWKICHIDPVSDRLRLKPEVAPFERLAAGFLRFMSPRNMFLVPKAISGAGEIPEVIAAVAAFERG